MWTIWLSGAIFSTSYCIATKARPLIITNNAAHCILTLCTAALNVRFANRTLSAGNSIQMYDTKGAELDLAAAQSADCGPHPSNKLANDTAATVHQSTRSATGRSLLSLVPIDKGTMNLVAHLPHEVHVV